MYGRVIVDGFSIDSAKGKGGWVDVLTQETLGVTNAFALEIDRQLMGGGKGILAQVAAASSGQVITVKNAGGISGDIPATKWFRKGQLIDVYGGGNKKGTVQINAIDPVASTITVSSNINVALDDYILRENTYESATTLGSGELMGIDGIVSTANTPGSDFQGIDRSQEPLWQAYVNSTGGTLSELLIQQDLDAIETRTDGEPIDLILTTYTLRNKLVSLMQALRTIDTLELKAGWKAIKYIGGGSEIPVLVHPRCPNKYMYYLSTSHLRIYMLRDLTWDDKGGTVKNVPGKDAYESWFKFYGNLGTDCPNAMGKTTNFTG